MNTKARARNFYVSDVISEDSLKRLSPYQLGEKYIAGEWDTKNLDDFMYRVFTDMGNGRAPFYAIFKHILRNIFKNPQSGSDAFNIAERHYDLGNDLFETMLDSSMSYTCGYWENAINLEQAQLSKLDLICRKIDLKPGMKVLDIGCGWGNFAKYAAEKYDVSVVGVTVSKEQAQFAKENCKNLPVEILLQDYRELNQKFDRIVSIEMIEAVGRRNLTRYFEVVNRCLKDQGLFILQVISGETISKFSDPKLDQFLFWILKHIFPDGYLPKISELVHPARSNLIIEDIHNFGPDYDKTLCAWFENFNNSWANIESRYGNTFKRRWNFYLQSCAALFRARIIQLYQIVYSKGGTSEVYSSRR